MLDDNDVTSIRIRQFEVELAFGIGFGVTYRLHSILAGLIQGDIVASRRFIGGAVLHHAI